VGWIVLLIISVALIPTRRVYAYLDPGTGSFIIQILIASLLGLALSVRLFWSRILGLFKKPAKLADDEEPTDASEPVGGSAQND
jgi:hypothetical protein